MSQKLETLNDQLAAARADLNRALASGEDTTEARYTIAHIENEIAAHQRIERERRAEDARKETAKIERAAVKAAAQAHEAVEADATVEGLAELTGEPLPAVERDPALDAAALVLARARLTLERAEAELKPLVDHAHMLADRLAEKRAAINAISRRRLAGDEQSDDAAQMGLLTADAEALEMLVADANAKVTAADSRPQARAALSTAERQLEQLHRQITYRIALDRVRQIEAIFVSAWRGMVDAGRAAGKGSPWSEYQACPEMRRAVTGAIVPGFRGSL